MGKWEMVAIPDVLFFQEGPGVRNTQYTSSGVKLLNVANLQDGKVDLSTSERYISKEEAYGKYKHFLVDADDFIIASSGIKVDYFEKKMGFVSSSQLPLCMNTSTVRFKSLDKSKLFIRYFMYYLKTLQFKEQLSRLITGSAQLNFGPSHIKQMTIPLPPLPIQQKIADVLDRANALIEKRKAQITKLDLLVKSQFVEMFGDPVTNPMGWEQKELQEFILFLTSGSRGWSSFFCDKGEIFLTIKNVKNSCLLLDNIQHVLPPDTKEAKRTRVQANDLLISITADLGRTAIVNTEVAQHGAYINQHLSLLRLNTAKVNPIFISYYLESQAGKMQFEAKNQVGVKSGLNFEAINSLVVLIPPITLQTQFAVFVERVEAQKMQLKKSLELLDIEYKSLMQKCFKGGDVLI